MMIDDEDIYIGNKFIGLVNNEVIEIVDIYRGSDDLYRVKLKDKKGNHYETLMDHFMHLQFKKIKEVKDYG